MSLNFFKLFSEMIKNQSKYPLPHTKATFKALTEAIIPNTLELSENTESIQFFGALDSHIDEYEIWSLDHFISLHLFGVNYNIYLANATAKMLDIAASELISSKGNKEPINSTILSEEGNFAALSQKDRFRAIALLEQLKVDLWSLPLPFCNNPGFVLALTGAIAMFATIGYYTEWSGFGTTSKEIPEKRKLEHFPLGWKQSGYPGPSRGYHAFRGYLIEKFLK